MSEQSYYNHCREQGMHCTYAEAKHARDSWMATFREMSLHMTRLDRMPTPEPVAVQYGFGRYARTATTEIIDEEDEGPADYSTEYDNGKANYLGITLTGMRRAKCTANSAANIRFQGLVSQGAKLAGWELVRAGYADRFRNFIHDEFLLQFRPQELDEHIPIVERLMLVDYTGATLV